MIQKRINQNVNAKIFLLKWNKTQKAYAKYTLAKYLVFICHLLMASLSITIKNYLNSSFHISCFPADIYMFKVNQKTP